MFMFTLNVTCTICFILTENVMWSTEDCLDTTLGGLKWFFLEFFLIMLPLLLCQSLCFLVPMTLPCKARNILHSIQTQHLDLATYFLKLNVLFFPQIRIHNNTFPVMNTLKIWRALLKFWRLMAYQKKKLYSLLLPQFMRSTGVKSVS